MMRAALLALLLLVPAASFAQEHATGAYVPDTDPAVAVQKAVQIHANMSA